MRSGFYEIKRKTQSELLEMARTEHPNWPEAELGPWADSKQRFSIKIVQMLDPREAVPADFPTLLKRITCPALLITADPERGAILTDQDVADLQKLVPHLHREQLPDAGHNIRREQFSRYMEVVEAFLNEI